MSVSLLFRGSKKHDLLGYKLQVFANRANELSIEIETPDNEKYFISLDRDTAIKLSKELRKQVGYLKDENKDVF